MVFGTANTELTVPNLGGSGTAIVEANSDGTLKRSSISTNDIINNFNRVDGDISNIQGDISGLQNDLRSSSKGLGQAAEAAGAMGAALSGLPEVSLAQDEPVRCGFGAGGWGSQYSVAGGCAARVADRLHVNGAIAYTPSVDYTFGSTPSVGGRVGFSFPLGKLNKSNQNLAKLDPTNQQAMAKLVDQRDQQIAKLSEQLEKLQQSADSSEANQQLVALLKERIEQLEAEKQQADAENQRQDDKIKQLENKLSQQQSLMERMMKQMKKLIPNNN